MIKLWLFLCVNFIQTDFSLPASDLVFYFIDCSFSLHLNLAVTASYWKIDEE